MTTEGIFADSNVPISHIVEFVGLAGTGKSSLSQVLAQYNSRYLRLQHPNIRRAGNIPFFIRNWIRLSPVILHMASRFSFLPWRDFVWISILNGWHQRLLQLSKREMIVIMLDQGPIYLITELTLSGSKSLKKSGFVKWWDRIYETWACTLDIVIFLDASDKILINRIRAREKQHMVKNQTYDDIKNFLSRYRIAYAQVLNKLQLINPSLKIVRLDNSYEMIEETANRISEVISEE